MANHFRLTNLSISFFLNLSAKKRPLFCCIFFSKSSQWWLNYTFDSAFFFSSTKIKLIIVPTSCAQNRQLKMQISSRAMRLSLSLFPNEILTRTFLKMLHELGKSIENQFCTDKFFIMAILFSQFFLFDLFSCCISHFWIVPGNIVFKLMSEVIFIKKKFTAFTFSQKMI